MKTSAGTLRGTAYLLLVLLISAGLAACGGGGGSTSPSASGPATVRVSIASAPSFPAGTTFAPSTATLTPATAAPPANSPTFDNVIVTVTKLALIPSTGPEFPDANGELEMANSSAEEGKSGKSGFVTTTFDPVKIDLLHPPAGDNVNMAALLNEFSEVPAGEYSKIRVYYENVVGQKEGQDDMEFHPTANYHFDVHFVDGNLVIPVSTDTQGVRFYSVVIKLVGLKYHQAGQSGNILLRPQVFAEFAPPILYSVEGTADNVQFTLPSDLVAGSFDVVIGTEEKRVFVTFDNNTSWAYSDDVLDGSSWKILNVPNQRAVDAFRDIAKVMVIGWFDGDTFRGNEIIFTFPDVREGTADNVWIPPDNVAFVVQSGADNVVVFPAPDRFTAYYDNGTFPHPLLTQAAVDNGVQIKARGYNVAGGIEAFWITVGEITVGP
jgi:hypothetical protein